MVCWKTARDDRSRQTNSGDLRTRRDDDPRQRRVNALLESVLER
jgi:hypothetical protein